MELTWRALARDAPPPALARDEIQIHLVARDAAYAWRDTLLAAATGAAPSDLRHARGRHGRPYLDAPDAPGFSLAHTDAHALVALAQGTTLGVDLEAPRTVLRRDALLVRFFRAEEREAIAAAPDPDRLLLHAWAGKEALVKAIGRGIAYGLARVGLALDGAAVTGLATLEGPAATLAPWTVASFDLPGRYLGAIAWRGGARPVRAFVRGG